MTPARSLIQTNTNCLPIQQQVTLFFLFFMTLFGLLGVQLFGQIEKHCVVNGTRLEDITINSLAIPDTHCSGHPEYGNQCPPDMVCMELHLDKEVVGYNGFEHIGKG